MKNTLIHDLLISRVQGAIAEARALQGVEHPFLKGRYREIILSRLLTPVLPPTCQTLHGTTTDSITGRHVKFEDDILIVDRECISPIVFSSASLLSGEEAIVPIESVLFRVEVKSKLTATELKKTVNAVGAFNQLKMQFRGGTQLDASVIPQLIFAYDSDSSPENEMERIKSIIPLESGTNIPVIQCVCIAGKGIWFFGSKNDNPSRSEWMFKPANEQFEEVTYFLATILNTLPKMRLARDKNKGVILRSQATSIGNYIIDPEDLISFN